MKKMHGRGKKAILAISIILLILVFIVTSSFRTLDFFKKPNYCGSISSVHVSSADANKECTDSLQCAGFCVVEDKSFGYGKCSSYNLDISACKPFSRIIFSMFNVSWDNPLEGLFLEPSPDDIGFDIDLHVYSYKGEHIGINYSTGKYETQIEGARTSSNLGGGGNEWISLPGDQDCYAVIDSFPAFNWSKRPNHVVENITVTWQILLDDGNERIETLPVKVKINLNKPFIGPFVRVNNLSKPSTITIYPPYN